MGTDGGFVKFHDIEFELNQSKKSRKITSICEQADDCRNEALQILPLVIELWQRVESHSKDVEALDSAIEIAKELWLWLWSCLYIPSHKKNQEQMADLIKAIIRRAIDYQGLLDVQTDVVFRQLIEKHLPMQTTSFKLNIKSLELGLKQSNTDDNNGIFDWILLRFGRRISKIDDVRHMVLIMVMYALIVLGHLLFGLDIPAKFTQVAIFLVWIIVLSWLPLYFMQAINVNRSQLTIIIWATFFLWLAYGFGWGSFYTVLLFIWPLAKLLQKRTHGGHDLSAQENIGATTIGLLIVFLVSHQLIWLLGLSAWISFAIVTRISRNYYRRLDQVESIIREPSRRLRHRIIFFAYMLALLLIAPVFSSVLTASRMQAYIDLSVGLIGTFIAIVFAVQAIVPGITVWESENTRALLREQKILLEIVSVLRGFLLTSILAVGIALSFKLFADDRVDISFEPQMYFREIYHVGDVLTGLSIQHSFSPNFTTVLSIWVIFAALLTISMQVFAQTYYLFVAADALLIPLRARVQATPIQVPRREEISSTLEDAGLLHLQGRLFKSLNLWQPEGNTMVVTGYSGTYSKHDTSLYDVDIQLWDDFPKRSELSNIAKLVSDRIFYTIPEVDSIRIRIWSNFPGFKQAAAFAVNINRVSWSIAIKQSHKSLPLEYKWAELGANYHPGLLLDSVMA